MSDFISPLFQWLNTHPELAGLVTFIISAGESVAILGTIVPGSIMMTAIGTLAGAGVIPLWPTILWAILGAIVGDGISYWIGHYFKERLPKIWPFRRYPALLKSGEMFVHKYGAMSVFIGRFVGPVRALVPLVAGMLGMKPLQFTIANVTSAIGWAPAYMLPGILLGAAALELPPDIAIHVILVILLIALFISLCLWFFYIILKLISSQIDQIQNLIWQTFEKSPKFASLTVLLKHHDTERTHGQLNLAFYFLISVFLFLLLAIYVTHYGPASITINDALYHFSRGIRTKGLDEVMIYLTLLGQKQVLLPVVFMFFAGLVVLKRWRLAFHALALAILAAGGVFVIKHILQSPRPWGIYFNPETYSMPSGHATLATTVFMGLAFLIAGSVRKGRRWPIYTVGIIISFLVGLSRVYLGAHWFTDVLSAWLLSASVLIFVVISYERKNEKPIQPLNTCLASFLILSISYSFYYYTHHDSLKQNYTLIRHTALYIPMDTWWERNNFLPFYHVNLFGVATQTIQLEWVGNIQKIKQTLLNEGWNEPPARNWISTLHRIADIKSTQYLPMIAPQYLDRKPELILVRSESKFKNPLVLRLWEADRVIKENNEILWVGFISVIPRTYSWLYRSHQDTIKINPALLFPRSSSANTWQWKILSINIPQEHIKNQTILLVREKPRRVK